MYDIKKTPLKDFKSGVNANNGERNLQKKVDTTRFSDMVNVTYLAGK